jgi:uracil-DNA glycosylase
MVTRRFDRFIDALATTIVSERAYNQFSRIEGDLRGNAIRRRNLRLYLEEIEQIGPRMLLIGEAVSYRGGRLSGIAFVSEAVMLGGIDSLILGADHGYRKATDGPKLSTEASATMVWNAFPFHPFRPGNQSSNRAPTPAELETGGRFIEWLLRLFAFDTVVAIGNHASASLTRLGIAHEKVRHPSQGGKQKFVAGMARLSQRRKP